MIEISNMKKVYESGNEQVIANDNINYKFEKSGFYVILGKSGCGKTTLLNVLSGIDVYDRGEVLINGENIGKLSENERDSYRNIKIGIIFQQYNLLTDINVYDNLRIALEIQGCKGKGKEQKSEVDKKISEILKKVGLKGYEKRKINQLSGGEQQRIAIARTLLKTPDIIFADEPTGNLDVKTGNDIMELLKQLSKSHLVIMVSHDKESAYRYGDYIINMSDGKIVEAIEQKAYQYKYSFAIKSEDGIEQKCVDLNKENFVKTIEEYVNKIENDGTIEISNVKKELIVDECVCVEKNNEKINIIPKKLPGLYKLRLSVNFLKKRKLRLFFTTLLTALTVVLLFFSLYIFFYNKDEIVLEYMETHNPQILPVYTNTSYIDDFYIEQSTELDNGEYINSILNKDIDSVSNIGKYIEEQMIFYGEKEYGNATLIFLSSYSDMNLTLEGRMPKKSNEIAITDYIASKINAKIGGIIKCEGARFVITGIVETDYIEYQLDRKLSIGYNDDFLNFNYTFKYSSVYLTGTAVDSIRLNEEFLTLRCSDFFISRRENDYFNSFITLKNVNLINKENLEYGRLPKAENEIVVSLDFLQEHSLSAETCMDKVYNFKNIYDEKYNNYYTSYQNMYDYYKDGVKIVGVFVGNIDQMPKDIYVHEEIWNELSELYYKCYYGKYFVVATENNYEPLIKMSNEAGIYFNEPAINNIRLFEETIDELKPILLIILLVAMSINFIMIGTFINISINENKKNIGILRSLGVTMKDCVQIFNIEFYCIYTVSMLLATIGMYIITDMVNEYFMQNLNEVKYDIIKVNIIIYSIVLVIEFFINTISIKLPIRRIRSEKPIQTLKG